MFLARLRLRRGALRLVTHGWPVAPGAPLCTDRFNCGRAGCPTQACHPAVERWEHAICYEPASVAGWWRRAPYSVLLPTGQVLDVIEVPAPLGAMVLTGPRTRGAGPVMATPTGRWMFLVRPGQPLLEGLARRLDLVRHTDGSWVPAPPTRLVEGAVRWVVSPAEVGWRLPDGAALQRRLTAALASGPVGAAGIEPATPAMSTQCSYR